MRILQLGTPPARGQIIEYDGQHFRLMAQHGSLVASDARYVVVQWYGTIFSWYGDTTGTALYSFHFLIPRNAWVSSHSTNGER